MVQEREEKNSRGEAELGTLRQTEPARQLMNGAKRGAVALHPGVPGLSSPARLAPAFSSRDQILRTIQPQYNIVDIQSLI